jgi:hypothetical protein
MDVWSSFVSHRLKELVRDTANPKLSDVSRTGYLTISTYLRTSEPSVKNHETSFGDDLFLAAVRIHPNFSPHDKTSGDEWYRAVNGYAEFHVKWEWTPQVVSSILSKLSFTK